MTKNGYNYPVQDEKIWPRLYGGWFKKLVSRYETAKILRRRKKQDESIEISLLSPKIFRALSPSDIPLVFLAHNDRKLVPALLIHYRKLGITRFICVDDQSTDGCREWLETQPDVDVWTSNVRYKDAKRGKLWREALFERYGKRRWYVNIDADEFLVYDDCFKRPLSDLITKLESLGHRRLSAPMIDLYPQGRMSNASFEGQDARMPWDVAGYFDSKGYRLTPLRRFISLSGGPRNRRLQSQAELMKYPLTYWDDTCSFGVSIHQPTPFEWNFAPVGGVLLHFKFFSDTHQRIKDAVEDQQYFAGAQEYKKILDAMDADGEIDFSNENSRVYEGPNQLVQMGFMHKLWDADPMTETSF